MSNQVELPNHTIISYRSSPDKPARFLNVDKLEQSENFKKINRIYKNILQSVTSYDPQHIQELSAVEQRLVERMLNLKNEDKSNIDSYTTGFKGLIVTIATFGLNHLVGHYKKTQIDKEIAEINTNREHFHRALGQMESRAAEKTVHLKPQIIQDLESKRLADPTDELARLEESPRIKESLKHVLLTPEQKIALGHSLELQEHMKDTHYVFNHGQNLELILIEMVTKILEQEFEKDSYQSVNPLRHRNTAFQHIENDTHSVDWFKEQIGTDNDPKPFNDEAFRAELICTDCILESTRHEESALYFLSHQNILVLQEEKQGATLYKILHEIASHYIENEKEVDQLCHDLIEIFEESPKGGNLYSTCVPKDKFDESCYISFDYGRFTGEDESFYKERLDEMQSGQVGLAGAFTYFPNKEDPTQLVRKPTPQVRILAHKIQPEEGFHIVRNSTLSNEELQKIEDSVWVALHVALTGRRLPFEPKSVFKQEDQLGTTS